MKGAKEYSKMFKTGQYNRLYITSSSHARGSTFNIQVLPEGEEAKGNGNHNKCLNEDAVLVYGPISGRLGWTEEYGWIHEGKWKDDFEILYRTKVAESKLKARKSKILAEDLEKSERKRINNLLSKY